MTWKNLHFCPPIMTAEVVDGDSRMTLKNKMIIRVIELKPIMTKPKLVKAGFDELTLDRLMHSQDFYEVGFLTDGGQHRFITKDLINYLKRRTQCQF